MDRVLRWSLATAVAVGGGIVVWAEPPRAPEPSGRPAGTAATTAVPRGVEVYRSAFDKGAGSEWSKKPATRCPSGKHTFLGQFACESTTLSLDNLPEHGRVRLSFDLMIILTWDGDASLDQPEPAAPDVFDVTVDRGPRLVHASFVCRPSSGATTQSFPGRFPYDHLPPGTGAAESRTLGYRWAGGIGDGPDDYVYHIERTFAHSGKSLKIAFSGINLEANENETWGLENVRVELLSPAAGGKFDEAMFEHLWADLGSSDPKSFVPAIDGMIDLGDLAVLAIRRRLAPPAANRQQEQLIRRLIAKLDDDAWAEREKASAALADLGVAAEPALREARKTIPSPEVQTRIDELLNHLKLAEPKTEAGRRLRRVVEVLELIGTEQARGGLSDIAGRSGSLAAWEAKCSIQRLEGKAEIPTKLDLPPGLPRNTPVAPAPGGIRIETEPTRRLPDR